jgi:hypothetical protein
VVVRYKYLLPLFLVIAAFHAPAHADSERLQLRPDGTPHWRPAERPAVSWQLVEEKKFYLHNPPNSFTGLYRTQGIATDGQRWFFSWQYGLEIANENFASVKRNSSFQLPAALSPGIPAALLAQGLDHIGDFDYYEGILYASLDSTNGYTDGRVALFEAKDLSYTGLVYDLVGAPSNPKKDVASWVAVDAKRKVGYGKEWQSGNTINVYTLAEWSFDHTLTLDRPLERIQGAKAHGDWLYMSSDNVTRSIYRASLLTGHVEELFQLPAAEGNLEVEGIAVRHARGAKHTERGRCDDAVDLYIEMVVDPDKSGSDLTNTNVHLSVFHYRLLPDRK